MKKSKKKRRQTLKPQGVPPAAQADDPSAREAALTEDAARSGDSEALDAGSDENAMESNTAKEEEPQAHPEVPSRRQVKKAARQAKKERNAAWLAREHTLDRRQSGRFARTSRQAAHRMGTPDIGKTGVPHRTHRIRTTLSVLFTLSVFTFVSAYFAFDVPNWQPLDIGRITAAPQTGLMYDNSGVLITKIRGAENRVVIPLEDIPLPTRQVFLAAEDLRFYDHHGIDVVRLFGALLANIREGSYAQGASTITMQLIRQSHLSTRKTIARKLEEMWLAVQLERQMSKDEILAMYLNYIYFGRGAYGIQAAAQTYFGIDAKDLTLAQAAALASGIKAPSYYALDANESANRNRRGYILNVMLTQGMIDQQAHDKAVSETVALAEKPVEALAYGWFVDAVLDEAENLLGMTSDQVLTGGFIIDTTLSREHQELLEEQFTRDVFPANAADGTQVQGAAACVNTQTGEVLALVGGRSYDIRRGFNRATQLRRQPGSALKPLVTYAPAIDRFGYMTASVLKDEPTSFGGYKPRNAGYTYYGNVSIRSALSSSLNVACVSLMDQIGVQAGRDYLQSVGIPLDARDANLALALGSMTYGVSPMQLAAAYAPFGNGGTFHAAHLIRKVTDPTGRVLYQHRNEGTRVLKATSAYLMTSLLQSVTSSGTGAKLSAAGTPVAGKTGTVNMTGGGNRDIWMAVYNSDISCAFWMGFDDPDANHKLQGWVSGGDNTAAMARNYFRDFYKEKEKPQFTRPEGIVALEIDKQAIKWRGEPMLAVDLTPKAYRYTEYFTADNKPTKKSDVWTPPRSLNSFTIGHSDSGYPLLRLQPADSAIYRVQRDTYGESFILTELYGGQGETLYYTDTSAKPGVVYTYRVIPVHAELLNNGILLEGVQSVQVAQANLPPQGFWGRIRNWLKDDDDEEDAVTSMSENQVSMFWTD
ncbi:MAG: PBP1A family penicillin-binding protein [Clostridia bacterium]|nr:PBP1A family penicillin-binding protein [Clostridia bacterium]